MSLFTRNKSGQVVPLIEEETPTGKPQTEQGPAGGQQTERRAPRDASHGRSVTA